MTMKNFDYIKEEVKEGLWMSKIMELNQETKNIEKALRYFRSFAEEIDGGINKTWEDRNRKRLDNIAEKYRILLDVIGRDNIEKILASNIYRLMLPPKAYELMAIKDELLQKFDITDYRDLDLRYVVNQDIFIFWDSIMYIVNTMELN